MKNPGPEWGKIIGPLPTATNSISWFHPPKPDIFIFYFIPYSPFVLRDVHLHSFWKPKKNITGIFSAKKLHFLRLTATLIAIYLCVQKPWEGSKTFTFIAVFFIKAVWRRWKYSKLLQVILCHGHWLLLKFLWNFIKDFFYISGLSRSGAWKYKPTEQSWTGALGYPCLEEILGILMSKELPAWLRMTSVLDCLCPWAGQR